jgi:hypothetical protein
MEQMLIPVGLLGGLLLLGYAAVRWGADSIDGVDSPEWNRRRSWRVGSPARHAAGNELLELYAAPLPVLRCEIPQGPGESAPLTGALTGRPATAR